MTEKEAEDFAGCVAMLAYIPVAIILGCLMDAWVLYSLWQWFIVPVFPSAPHLSPIQAVGFGLVAAFLTHQIQYSPKGEKIADVIARSLMSVFFSPLMTLGIGYVVHKMS